MWCCDGCVTAVWRDESNVFDVVYGGMSRQEQVEMY